MAKSRFDWRVDARNNESGEYATFEDWDGLAAFTPAVIEMAQDSHIPVFVQHASDIYAILEDNGIKEKKAAVLLTKHERLSQLMDLWENSNFLDFWLIKFPFWVFNDFVQGKSEKRIFLENL